MKVFIVLALAAVALADQRPYAPPAPAYKPTSYNAPQYADVEPNYNFAYDVKDGYSGAAFNANEERNGYATNGGYTVALPDGRTQIVTYTVTDGYSGYVADVRYEGEAQYPEYKPTYKAAPAYAPAKPVYAPKPAAYHA